MQTSASHYKSPESKAAKTLSTCKQKASISFIHQNLHVFINPAIQLHHSRLNFDLHFIGNLIYLFLIRRQQILINRASKSSSSDLWRIISLRWYKTTSY